MTQKRALLVELSIVALISYWWFFIQTNVNPTLGNIYTNITVGAIAIVMVDVFFGKKSIKLLNTNIRWATAITWGVLGYGVLILSTQLASFLATVVPLSEIFNLLASSAPVFSNSPIINFITFGEVIAYIETYALFIAGFDLMASVFKVDINKKNLFNPKLQAIMIGISLLFLFLHVTAKGVSNEATLILVLLMAYISLFITAWTQDGRPALILHILANSIAATSIFVIVPAALPLVLFPCLFMMKNKKNKNERFINKKNFNKLQITNSNFSTHFPINL